MLLPFAIISVTVALLCYTINTFADYKNNETRRWSIVVLCVGFIFDIIGTIFMTMIAKGISINGHSVIGFTALLLMGIKTTWSMNNYCFKNKQKLPSAFSFIAWGFWVFVYIIGTVTK